MSDNPTLCTAIVVRHPTDPRRILMLRRHRADGQYDPWEGCWQNAGGRVEWGESPSQCAVRELWEEVGLMAVGPLELLGVTSHVVGAKHQVGIVYRAVRWSCKPVNREIDRHDAIEWVDIDHPPAPLMPGASEVLGWLRKE